MASAIPGRVERSARGGQAFGRAGPRERAQPPIQVIETGAPRGVDVCRLLVVAASLSAGVAIPVGLLLWVASDVLGGLGSRVLAMLP